MNCKHPIDISIKTGSETMTVHRSRKIDGKRVSRPDMPFVGRASYLVPCGKCLACKSRRKSEMTFRMDCEKRHGHLLPDGSVRRYNHCFFCTLTYADRMLPRFTPLVLDHRTGEVYDYVEVPEDHKGILNPLHLAEFMKRLRRYYDLDCKVFWCGEYGDDGLRPHYHAIFYSDFDWQQTVNAFRRAWSCRFNYTPFALGQVSYYFPHSPSFLWFSKISWRVRFSNESRDEGLCFGFSGQVSLCSTRPRMTILERIRKRRMCALMRNAVVLDTLSVRLTLTEV